jgi:hypothetical protein
MLTRWMLHTSLQRTGCTGPTLVQRSFQQGIPGKLTHQQLPAQQRTFQLGTACTGCSRSQSKSLQGTSGTLSRSSRPHSAQRFQGSS